VGEGQSFRNSGTLPKGELMGRTIGKKWKKWKKMKEKNGVSSFWRGKMN
jgi:hypothetical protein